jgi:acyl-homoserine-lactone acylase
MKKFTFPLLVLSAFLLLIPNCKAQSLSPQQLPQKSEILWDTWDVPHIYAESSTALGYGFGWAQMKSYSNEILKLYGLARGRGAEFWGENYLDSDRLMHQIGIPEDAVKALEQQPDDIRKYLQAFADGMNEYALDHPQEIDAEVREVLPVQPEDIIRHMQRAFFTFVSAVGNSPSIVGLSGLPPNSQPGSNTIAIGPSRSKSGNAMLLQNPHLPYNFPLMRFYEAHLIGPEFDLYGAALIGVPMIVIGFNEYMGWSHTVNTVDVIDTYLLTLDSNGYRFDGEISEFQEHTKIIKNRQEDGSMRNDTLLIRRSIHGPVIQSTDTSAIAIRTPMLDRFGMLQQYWDMGSAKNFDQFEAALRQHQLPMFTTTYADKEGHIFYLFAGQIPKRSHGDFRFWQQPVAGDTPKNLWTEIHSFDELPSLFNPESGFLQNSNSPPWFATFPSNLNPGDYPKYMAPEGLNLREQRGLEMLLDNDSISFEDLLEIRYSNRMLLADRVFDDLLPAAQKSTDSITRAAAEVLSTWDRQANSESKGAVLFTFWASEICKIKMCAVAVPWNSNEPISTPNGLADPDTAAAILGKVARQVQDQFGSLDVPWGEVMRFSDEIPGVGAPGYPFGVYQVVAYQPSEKGEFQSVHGDTWVAVIEFTKNGPRAEVLMSYGNSSNADDEQFRLLSNKKMRPVWNTRALIEQNLKSTNKFEYQVLVD